MGADGRPYTFRPLRKSLLELLPEHFLDTFVEEIVEDQLKSAFPTAPPVVPVILDAVDVLHNVPRIIVLPDDPALGEYQEQFAGQVGTIEQWPNEGPDNTPGFAGATEIHGTDELLEVLRSDPKERVDVHNFLTARLVDLSHVSERREDLLDGVFYGEHEAGRQLLARRPRIHQGRGVGQEVE